MAAGLAHELNQPLTAIMLQSETAAVLARELAGELTGPLCEKFVAVVNTIGSQAVRAAEIIRLLRRLVKKSAASRSTVSLDQVIRDSLTILNHDIDHEGVVVDFHSDPDMPPVLGDTIQLQQVIINLLRNAIEAMDPEPPGGKRIEITCRQKVVAETPGVGVAISDCGTGINPADASRIFESFYTTKPQGIGMGLAICRSIVTAHGGTIDCHPNPDAGVTFEFAIPVHGAA
jgi:signal transduction histidine kinase